MSLNDKTRAKIVQSNHHGNNFEHLKIECRARDRQYQHEGFGKELFNAMKSVKSKQIFIDFTKFCCCFFLLDFIRRLYRSCII